MALFLPVSQTLNQPSSEETLSQAAAVNSPLFCRGWTNRFCFKPGFRVGTSPPAPRSRQPCFLPPGAVPAVRPAGLRQIVELGPSQLAVGEKSEERGSPHGLGSIWRVLHVT